MTRRKKLETRQSPMSSPGQVPLERALSKLGLASRSQTREWILAGRLTVNGVVERNPERQVVPERTKFAVDDIPLTKAKHKTVILYKPRGVITTRSDEKNRPTVFSLLPSNMPHLNAVGRLDLATSGLLILTNDNRFGDWLSDPANAIPRVYLSTVNGEFTEEHLAKLRKGVSSEGETLRAEHVEIRKASHKETHLIVKLTEGKNREIRRLFLALDFEVTSLKRVSFGALTLGDLAPGKYREISLLELRQAFPNAPISE
jgi:23S rRNA pseudouridine2605 synthase